MEGFESAISPFEWQQKKAGDNGFMYGLSLNFNKEETKSKFEALTDAEPVRELAKCLIEDEEFKKYSKVVGGIFMNMNNTFFAFSKDEEGLQEFALIFKKVLEGYNEQLLSENK